MEEEGGDFLFSLLIEAKAGSVVLRAKIKENSNDKRGCGRCASKSLTLSRLFTSVSFSKLAIERLLVSEIQIGTSFFFF